MTAPANALEAALAIAALGVPVHPLHPNKKTPAWAKWQTKATTDTDTIRAAFANGANLGIAWPQLTLDCDDPARVLELEATYPELGAAPAVDTPRGGRHWYLRSDEWRIPTRAAAAPGLDIRGFGRAYTVGPASRIDGTAYTLVRPFTAPHDAPQASEALRAYLGPKPKPATPPRPPQRPTAPANAQPWAAAALNGEADRVRAAATGTRNHTLNAAAFALGQLVPGGYLDEATATDHLLAAAIAAGLELDEARTTIRSGLTAGNREPRHPPERTPAPPGATAATVVREAMRADQHLAAYDLTDAGNAERLLHLFRDRLRYCAGLGWLVWTGTHWQPDGRDHPTASRLALLAMRATAATAEHLDGKDDREALHKHARRSQNAKALQNLMQVAAFIDPTVLVSVNDLDPDPWLLNVENGLLDLRTATLHPHTREAMCTRIAPTRFELDAQHHAFAALHNVLNQDGRATFLQAIAGQALTGRSAKALYLLTGPSGTAKSTTADALAAVLGPDYAVQLDPQTLLVNPHGNNAGGARADLVALRGARLAIAAELPNGGRLDGVLVKRLTGGDPITCRAPYAAEMMTFTPGHTVLVHSNHDPKIDWTDDGMRARVMPVPFTIRPDKPNPAIRAALLDDPDARAAMLTWATLGAVGWHRDKQRDPTPPDLVTNRKAAYLREQNPFTAWADDALNATGNYTDFTTSAELHANYRAWCEANGERAQSAKALGQYLASEGEDLGITAEKRKHARGWSGLTLCGRTE